MALFYASGSRRDDTGKFRQRQRPGMQQDSQHRCGDFRFELLSMATTTPVARTRFHVRIFTKRDIRVAFLRDFSSARQAIAAAEQWVYERELLRRSRS